MFKSVEGVGCTVEYRQWGHRSEGDEGEGITPLAPVPETTLGFETPVQSLQPRRLGRTHFPALG